MRQVMNELYFRDLQMQWYQVDALNRTTNSSTDWYFDGLPIYGRTGQSQVTNHTVHIWDRSFANRAGFLGTEACPPKQNWASMPNHKHLKKRVQLAERLQIKMKQFDEWDELCGTSPFT